MKKLKSRLEQIKNDLAEMYWKDQNMRNSYFSSGEEEVEWDDSLDKRNTEKLKLIIEEIGWPIVSLVGSESSMQAWLLVQHADHDPEFQVHCLELMKKQPDGEVKRENIAYLEDRIRVGNGSPQLYGTQFYTGKNGKLEPQPIENPEQLEERRSQMGLGTFESYLAMMHETYGNEDGDRESACATRLRPLPNCLRATSPTRGRCATFTPSFKIEVMKVNYRKFKTSDYEGISQMMHNLYKEDPGTRSMTKEKALNTFNSLKKHPDRGAIMVIEANKEIVGYAIIINFWSNEFGGNVIHIDEFYIKKEYRSQGMGTGFIKYLADTHFANSVTIQLEITPKNTRAKKLYENLGFKKYRNNTYNLELE